jgi:hypothetical protein
MFKGEKIMFNKKIISCIVIFGFLFGNIPVLGSIIEDNIEKQENYKMYLLDSPPYPTCDTIDRIVDINTLDLLSQVILPNVPSSQWTYGCGPTAAGMLFGYYDRIGYPNMYTGPCNGGVCPLTDLGQCYIIATEKGLDGITTKGHVDDYWISTSSPGPDPWFGSWPEHSWSRCVADFLGSNQWKWDYFNDDSVIDSMMDGSTAFWSWETGEKLHDYMPPAECGTPRTSFCHGLKLFAQSRGYVVVTNYNQRTNNQHNDGFTFYNFKAEIDAGRPVLVHLVGHAMLGLGYDDSKDDKIIFIHDGWTDGLKQMPWGGQYANKELFAVTVFRLASAGNDLPSIQINKPVNDETVEGIIAIQGTASDPDGTVVQVLVKIDDDDWKIASGTINWGKSWDTSTVSNGQCIIQARCIDNKGASSEDVIVVNVNNPNLPPDKPTLTGPTSGKSGTKYTYESDTTDPEQDQIYYWFDWGDGTNSGWLEIKVKAKDSHDAESEWSDSLPISMPKNKIINPFERFLEQHPYMFPLLRQLLELK